MAYTCGVTNYLLGAHPASRYPQVFDDERALDIGGCFSEGTRGKAGGFFQHRFNTSFLVKALTAVSNLSL